MRDLSEMRADAEQCLQRIDCSTFTAGTPKAHWADKANAFALDVLDLIAVVDYLTRHIATEKDSYASL